MINKISFYPKTMSKLKKTAMIGLLGASSLTASAIVPPPAIGGAAAAAAANAATTARLANSNKNKENKTYNHNRWKQDSINISNQIKQHQAQINKLKEELKTKKQELQTCENNTCQNSPSIQDFENDMNACCPDIGTVLQLSFLCSAIIAGIVGVISLIFIHKGRY